MKVIIQYAGNWLYFQRPERVLIARQIEEVLPMLRKAEESRRFAAGFISYEAAPAFDRALKTRSGDKFPLLCLGLFQAPETMEHIGKPPPDRFKIRGLKPSISEAAFAEAIGTVRKLIAEGKTYQVNYTYRLHADFSGDTWAFFQKLVQGGRTGHAVYVETDDFSICSASPELFFDFRNGRIVSRPMKGTAGRGRTLAEDWERVSALRASKKEQAENIMIVDMVRSDIGRIAKPGSIKVVSQFDIEKYPAAWQMTSTVCGKSGAGITSIMKALFPCASVTGAPKAKTMEIIRSLEPAPRRIYTGSIGFMTPEREGCFNVAIRTALIHKTDGRLEFGVGGGIVWDSNAQAEYEETLVKAQIISRPQAEFQLLETMRWDPCSGVFLLEEHMRRISCSAMYFDVPFDLGAVLQKLEQAVEKLKNRPHRIRLLVSKNGASKIEVFPFNGPEKEPGLVAVAKDPVDSRDPFLFHKTTRREVYERAKADFPQHDDVLLWNERGELTESCTANVVVRRKNRLISPLISCGLLAGTFRERLLQTGRIKEEAIPIEGLQKTDEILLINSVRKWRRVVLSS